MPFILLFIFLRTAHQKILNYLCNEKYRTSDMLIRGSLLSYIILFYKCCFRIFHEYLFYLAFQN